MKNAKKINTIVKNPLFQTINSYFLFDEKNKTAYIVLAKTAGLELLSEKDRNPCNTTTYGLGEQVLIAKNLNAKNITIGLGGSSTNNAGIGMAAALGYIFFDENGHKIIPIGKNLMA